MKKQLNKKSIIAGFFGNILEWYDFVLYGYFAPVLAQLFFPSEDKIAALIATFGVFAAGFFFRPLGAIIFGVIGDKIGRKQALLASIFLMAIPTTLVGLLPTHAQVGILAPILLIIIRLLQGISVGGELTGSISYLIEESPPNKRGFVGSWSTFGVVVGIVLASGVAALVTSLVSQEELVTWGWRIPFFFGAFVGLVGFYLRKEMVEPSAYSNIKEAGNVSNSPLKDAIKGYWKEILTLMFSNWLFCTSFYMIFIYLSTYISTETKVPLDMALDINTFGLIVMLLLIPIMGHLSDKYGRKPLLIVSCIGFIILSYPLFLIIEAGSINYDIAAQLVFVFFIAMLQGVIPAFNVEMFPTKIRMTAMSIGYNASQAVFGGTTPLVATYLIKQSGMKTAPAFYLIICAIISLVFYLKLRDNYKEPLK